MRTIIDGSTADIRESPDWIVLSTKAGDGFNLEAACRAFAEPIAVQIASPAQQADITAPEILTPAFR